MGIAGGASKCRHAVEVLGFDVCIDRNDPEFASLLAAACARVPVCGHIADYNRDTPSGADRGAALMAALVQKRIRMQGFVILDHYG